MTIKQAVSRLPLWWKGLALSIVVLCATAAIATAQLAASKVDYLHAQYGQTLVNLAARRALEATANKDRISLQAIMQEIADNDFVMNARVHDVENNLLAQAGPHSQSIDLDTIKVFTAPITVHNSVAGYMALTVDSQSTSTITIIYGSFALLALLLAAALLVVATRLTANQHERPQRQTETPIKTHVSLPIVEQSIVKPTTETREPDTKRVEPQAQLLIHFYNLRELHGQLNQSSLRSVTEKLEIKLRDVMALYSGRLHSINAEHAVLDFADHTRSQAIFNALCSAKLLLALNQHPSSIHLRFSCVVLHRNSSSQQLKNLPFELFTLEDWQAVMQQTAPGKLLVESNLLGEEPSKDERFTLTACAEHDDLSEITAFNEPYNSLLTKQIKQLEKH